jgi:hypothetical protein
MERRSLEQEAKQEAERERWYQSERAGYDVGEQALRSWVHRHWRGFLLARWLEHLQGVRFWIELSPNDFGLLKETPNSLKPHLNELIGLIRSGGENLHVLQWTARLSPESRAAAIELLSKINMNCMRLRVPFGTEDSDLRE